VTTTLEMNANLNARLAELASLKPGWLNGEGKTPTTLALKTAGAVLHALLVHHPEVLRPWVYPTISGGVQAEWDQADLYFAPEGGVRGSKDLEDDDKIFHGTEPGKLAAEIARWLG
jgi:hypothetical protein